MNTNVDPRSTRGTNASKQDLRVWLAEMEAAGEVTTLGAVEDQGDLAYRAPECLMGDAATPAADVYSLGATLYEALTGRPAVDPNGLPSEVTACAMARPARGPRERLPKLPAAVDALVRRAMARDPGERLTGIAASPVIVFLPASQMMRFGSGRLVTVARIVIA